MLPTWDPLRIEERLPVVLAAVGARRCGKSTAIGHLVYQMFDKFDLVICFVGSAACSPCLEAMMQRHPNWDERFFFPQWNKPLIERLLRQQEDLKRLGTERQVLILCDDVILGGRDEEQLAHMCMRGRHFNISVMMCAVSYTSINKRARRSLDCLLCFSCPMQGDRKVLSWEFASNSHTADYMMSNLEENECLVFETSRKRQKLMLWKAVLLTPEMFSKSIPLPVLSELKMLVSRDSGPEPELTLRRTKSVSPSNRTRSEEPREAPVCDENAPFDPASPPESTAAGQISGQVLNV